MLTGPRRPGRSRRHRRDTEPMEEGDDVARRALSNPLALAVLATLSQRPMHPYEMASTMREQHYDTAVKLNYGSLYSVVESLRKAGCIDVEGVERTGNRPERTVYRITPAGRVELTDRLGAMLGRPAREYPEFVAGLAFMVTLHPDEVRKHLARRVGLLGAEVAGMREELADAARGAGDAPPVARVFLLEDEYQLRMRETELAWVRELLGDLAAGTLDGLPAWAAHHEGTDPARG